MNYYQDLTIAEQKIQANADINFIPIAGTFELTPLCNMDCRMCYVRMSKNEMEAMGRLRTADEWTALGKSAVEQGMMFLLLTGGEPFLYPDFIKVYEALRNMGLVIMINSNGTLLTNDILEVLATNKPRRINISLYGSNDKIYCDLCRNPHGFTQVMNCVERLRSRDIDVRFNMALTPWNKDDFPNMLAVADRYMIPTSIANYIFPANRRNLTCKEAALHRFPPELAGRYGVEVAKLYNSKEELLETARHKLEKANNTSTLDSPQRKGFWCRGGTSSFWITWDWRLLPCGMVQHPAVPVNADQFQENWVQLRTEMQKIVLSPECYNCPKKAVCQTCAAAMITETGAYDQRPEYHCYMTDAMLDAYANLLKETENE